MFELGEKVGRGDVHLKLIRVAENLQKLIQINVQGVHGSIPKIEKYSDAVRILHIFLNGTIKLFFRSRVGPFCWASESATDYAQKYVIFGELMINDILSISANGRIGILFPRTCTKRKRSKPKAGSQSRRHPQK